MSSSELKTIAVLPRVTIQIHGKPQEHSCAVGPVTIWRDSEELWPAQFNRSRPSWLRIFREFPHTSIDTIEDDTEASQPNLQYEAPSCSYGSVMTCEDPDWLRDNLEYLLSVLYFLAAPTGDFIRPAECFESYLFNPSASQSHLVGLLTKTGEKIESAQSLLLTPTLALRAAIRVAPLRMDLDYCKELIARLFDTSNDRLVIACRHFFRASFEGTFQSPWEQDIAAYCACLEAALDIPEGKFKEGLMGAAEDLLGKNEELREFIAGAYTIRSVLNHGAVAVEGDNRTESLKRFREHASDNTQTLRRICAFAIQERLTDAAEIRRIAIERAIRDALNHDLSHIVKRFRSDELWSELSNRFASRHAVNAIDNLTTEVQGECHSFCCRFLKLHDWAYSKTLPKPKLFLEVLRTMSCSFGVFAKNCGAKDIERRGLALFDTVKDMQFNGLMSWIDDNDSTVRAIAVVQLENAIYAAAHHFASLAKSATFRATLKDYMEQKTPTTPTPSD